MNSIVKDKAAVLKTAQDNLDIINSSKTATKTKKNNAQKAVKKAQTDYDNIQST
jgi:hypothetical protein